MSPWSRQMRRPFTLALALLTCFEPGRGATCADEELWTDPTYGQGCNFYAQHDPGCKKFVDLGQIANCNATCGNCDGSRTQEADPLDTTCSMEDLCACFEGCSPASICPASDAAQACRTEVAVAEAAVPPSAGKPWLELRLAAAEHVLGVEVRGGASSYAKTMTAMFAAGSGSSASFAPVDGGQLLPANWEGGDTVRVLFGQGPIEARSLRLYPNHTAGGASAPPELAAEVVVKRCGGPAGPMTPEGRCNDLKCRAYCYRKLSCEGEWETYCGQRKAQEESCDVDCSSAMRAGGRSHAGAVAAAALIACIAARLTY